MAIGWCHSFLFPASVCFISKVRFISKVKGEFCCCHSFIYYQIINVNVSFISEVRVTCGPRGIVSQLFSTPMCPSFQKSASPVGFLLSACLRRLFGWLLFMLNFELIINLFNFFRSSMAYTHYSIFECVGFELGALRVRVWHAYLLPTRCHGIANASFTPF